MTFNTSKTPNADPDQGSALWIINVGAIYGGLLHAQSYVAGASRTIGPH